MAIDCDGTGDYVHCGDIAALDGASDLTVAAWVKIDTLAVNDIVACKGRFTDNRWSMGLSDAGLGDSDDVSVYLTRSYASGMGYTTGNILGTGSWHHWCMVFDGGGAANADRLKFYFDGVLQTLTFVGTIPATTVSTTYEFTIGAREHTAPDNYIDGKIEDAAIWDAELTAAQVGSLACGIKGLPLKIESANLQAYWPMNEDPAGTAVPADAGYVRDLTGNSHDGTKAGDPAYAEGNLSYPGWPVYVHAVTGVVNVTVTPSAIAMTGAQPNEVPEVRILADLA